jgi:SAM-dependent methyltransferase
VTRDELWALFKPDANVGMGADGVYDRVATDLGAVDVGFDERWKRHPKAQATTAGVLWMKTGWEVHQLANRSTLDAGAGCGRFSAVARDAGADIVAVDGSMHGCRATAELDIPAVHADLLDLPFRAGVFDKAFSIGVLHHTSDPERAFCEVARCVRPGGEFAVWVYAQPCHEWLLPHMRWLHEVTRACPPEVLHEACEKYAIAMRDTYASRGDMGGLGALAQILQASGSLDDEECISDTFDWHTPQFRSYHTANEVRGWFERAGFEVVWTGTFPVSMRGRKR